MKKTALLIFSFITLGVFCAASCEKEEEPATDGNNYAEMIVGTWQVDALLFNGQDITPENLLLIMNEDGTGLVNNNGETENNGFTWTIKDDKLTIVNTHGPIEYTIKSLTENDAEVVGSVVPGTDMQGDVTMQLVRVR